MIRCVKIPVVALISVVLAATISCKKEGETKASPLEQATTLLSPPDFSEKYDQGLALLDALAGDHSNLKVAYAARLRRGLAHLDLFIAALVTGDPELFEKCKSILNWELEGDLYNVRNFQLLVQDIMEEFKLVAREGKDYPELASRANDLASFCLGIQGLFYRDKRQYMAGRGKVRSHTDLAYLADLMALRDLTHETLRRGDGFATNWQNVVLTVLGPVCLSPALKYVDMLCIPADPSQIKDHCEPDFNKLSPRAREGGAKFLSEQCTLDGGEGKEGPLGMAAIRSYYDSAYERLVAVRGSLAPQLSDKMEAFRAEMEKAYGVLEAFAGYSNSPPKSK